MVGWDHQLDGHEFEQAAGVGDGQGSLACCSPWGHKESDTTELNLSTKPKELQYKEQITARQRLSLRRSAYRSPKPTGETKTRMLQESEVSDTCTYSKKHYSTPHPLSIKYHSRLFTSVSITQHLGLSTKNYMACRKVKENSLKRQRKHQSKTQM